MKLGIKHGTVLLAFIFLGIFIARWNAEVSGPIEGSIHHQVQQDLMEALAEDDRQDKKRLCQKIGSDLRFSTRAVVWYDNVDTGEYRCLLIDLESVSVTRLNELKAHSTVMNSKSAVERYDKSLR